MRFVLLQYCPGRSDRRIYNQLPNLLDAVNCAFILEHEPGPIELSRNHSKNIVEPNLRGCVYRLEFVKFRSENACYERTSPSWSRLSDPYLDLSPDSAYNNSLDLSFRHYHLLTKMTEKGILKSSRFSINSCNI